MGLQSLPHKTPFGQVRAATSSDVDCIVTMAHKLAAHHGDTATLSAAELLRDAFTETPWIYLIIAEADGAPVGFAALCGLIQLHFATRGFDIHHLYTEPHFRGQGVGTSMIEACKAKAKAKEMSCGYISVSTHPDNFAAQAFYESRGFFRPHRDGPRFGMRLG